MPELNEDTTQNPKSDLARYLSHIVEVRRTGEGKHRECSRWFGSHHHHASYALILVYFGLSCTLSDLPPRFRIDTCPLRCPSHLVGLFLTSVCLFFSPVSLSLSFLVTFLSLSFLFLPSFLSSALFSLWSRLCLSWGVHRRLLVISNDTYKQS